MSKELPKGNFILVNERWALKKIPHNLALYQYAEVIDKKTKAAKLSWFEDGKYFPNIQMALRYIIREECEEEANNLQEYLKLLDSKMELFNNNINK